MGAFLFGGYSAETALVIYFLETILGIFLAAAFVLLRAPADHAGYTAGLYLEHRQRATEMDYRSSSKRSMLSAVWAA